MAKKKRFNRCVVTERDIIFDVVYERYQGYNRPKGKQTKAGVKRLMRNNFEDMRFIKGSSPKFTEWQPITESDEQVASARAKCCFSCGLSSLKKFVDNTAMSFDGKTMGILGLDGKVVDAYSFSTDTITDYYSSYERDYFKWAGDNAEAIYLGQNSYMDKAYIGVKIPEERLVEAIEASYGKKMEKIKGKSQLKNLELNINKLTTAYTLALEWVREMSEKPYNFDKPLPAFNIDFREQDLFS